MDMSEDEGLSGDSTATRESEAAERSLATTDGFISIINKQVEDALKPLLSVLRGVEEDEHKHQEKLLAIEKRKLALKNEKVLLFTRHGTPSWNSPISQPQVGPINVMGNAGSSPEPVKDGTEEKGAVSARPSSGSDGILQPSKLSKTDVTKHKTPDDENLPIANKLVAFPAVRFCLSDDSNEGDHSVERMDRSSEGDHSHSDKNLPKLDKVVACSNVRSCLSDKSNEGKLACPRCEGLDSKFCYYNHNKPRHFCKSCQRYWTVAWGTLRNVLMGAGRRRRNKAVGGLHLKAFPEPVDGTEEKGAVRGRIHSSTDESDEGVQSDVFKDRLSEGDHSLSADLSLLDKVERRVCREHFRPEDWVEETEKLVSGHPNGPPKIVTEDETSDDTKRVRLFGQILTPPGMSPCFPGRTSEADSFHPGKLVQYGALNAKSPASSEEGELKGSEHSLGNYKNGLPIPSKVVQCPRCDSLDTKFCYYNNYNINQPRHFCNSCQRFWTTGGTLRNTPVGAGRRKNKGLMLQHLMHSSQGGASLSTPLLDSDRSEVQSTGSCVSSVGQQHQPVSALGKRGAADGGRQEDAQLPAKALKRGSVICKSEIVNPTLKSNLELSGACEQENSSVVSAFNLKNEKVLLFTRHGAPSWNSPISQPQVGPINVMGNAGSSPEPVKGTNGILGGGGEREAGAAVKSEPDEQTVIGTPATLGSAKDRLFFNLGGGQSRGTEEKSLPDLKQLLERDKTFADEQTFEDQQTFEDLMRFSKIAISHQESLARVWKNKQANAVELLREQLDSLQQRKIESERKKKEILDEHAAERFYSYTDGDEEMLDPVTIGEDFICHSEPASLCSSIPDSASSVSEYEGNNSPDFWREKAKALDSLLSESHKREESLNVQLRESIAELPSRLSGELHEQFKHFNNFLRFTLRKAPVVFGHQDRELRYRFIHNAFPTLTEEEVIGKTDEEIYQGMGVPELMEFKRQVIRTKVPDKQEIKFDTNMFGSKTFMIAVEPVLDTEDVCVGLNYVAMDVTLQVAKREKLAGIEEEEAVQRAMESELNKTIYITEETMRARQMLATMAHEIRSPLSGVISMASILARTPLNEDQKLQVDFMIKSGNDVLDLINDILDLSKVEAGAMTFEAKKFRPREVVKHVVQMASTSVAADNKTIQVESDVSEDVPLEVVGDVLRIRQVLTNLVSNSVKFTHKGKVSIIVRVVEPSSFKNQDRMKPKQLSAYECDDTSQRQSMERSALPMTVSSLESPHIFHKNGLADPLSTPASNIGAMFPESNLRTVPRDERLLSSVKPPNTCQRSDISGDVPTTLDKQRTEEQISASSLLSRNAAERVALANTGELVKDLLWIEFHVVDTGIGIPESAIPTLFKRYSQASSTHARKYGGTGLGLHICKQLVELMGGNISVLSKERDGSLFSFKLPLRPVQQDSSNPISNDEIECVRDQEDVSCTDAPGSFLT